MYFIFDLIIYNIKDETYFSLITNFIILVEFDELFKG